MFASALLDAVEDPGVLGGDVTYYPDETAGESQTIGSFDDGLDDSVDVLNLDPDELQAFRWEKVSMVFQGR